MHNYLKYKSLLKVFFLFILIGNLNKVQAQTDSLLQTLLVDEKIDSQLIAPKKMLFTQQLIWGEKGIFKNRYGNIQDPIDRRKIDLRIRRKMLQLHHSTFKRDKKLTSIRLHKWLAIAHMSGMLATNILASQLENNYALKPYHRAAAYTSFVSLAAAMVVIKF
ncbi:MAG: hypothetical protein EBS04_06405 [Chitinophagia bacterium]|nr:hypothetical protein [Chitinophagia bacterium]